MVLVMYTHHELQRLAEALGGLPVLACRADSPAGRAGVSYGDILLVVNGVRTTDWCAFVEARSLRKDGMSVEVFRDGEHLQFEVSLDEGGAPHPADVLAGVLAERVIPLEPAWARITAGTDQPN